MGERGRRLIGRTAGRAEAEEGVELKKRAVKICAKV